MKACRFLSEGAIYLMPSSFLMSRVSENRLRCDGRNLTTHWTGAAIEKLSSARPACLLLSRRPVNSGVRHLLNHPNASESHEQSNSNHLAYGFIH